MEITQFYPAVLTTTELVESYRRLLLHTPASGLNRMLMSVGDQLLIDRERREGNAAGKPRIESACITLPDDPTIEENLDWLLALNIQAKLAEFPNERLMYFVLIARLVIRLKALVALAKT